MRNARRIAVLVALGTAVLATPLAAQSDAPRTDAGSTFWQALGDPVLDRLVERALSASPELRAASARADGAGASRLQAALEMGPVVRADAGYTRQRLASATSGSAAGVFPDQDVWASGLSLGW